MEDPRNAKQFLQALLPVSLPAVLAGWLMDVG